MLPGVVRCSLARMQLLQLAGGWACLMPSAPRALHFEAPSSRQVTRKWLNWEGEAVAEHLAGELAALEADPRVRGALQ